MIVDSRIVFGYWLIVVAFVALSARFLFFGTASTATKRTFFYWYTGIGGVLVMGWFCLVGGPKSLLLFIPCFAVAAYISLKTTRFCDSCGKVLMNQFMKARFCPRCGADLDAQDALRKVN